MNLGKLLGKAAKAVVKTAKEHPGKVLTVAGTIVGGVAGVALKKAGSQLPE